MPKKTIDWKQKYEDQIERDKEIVFDLRRKTDDLEERYYKLNKEFDKAVEINKNFQNIIIEQRGIINYLEIQISKLKD
jgi:hypothetical protein